MAEVQVRYTARKKLIPPVVEGDEVLYRFEMETMTSSIYDSIKSSEMIDGTTYDVELFGNERYDCSTINYEGDELAELRQFLYSVRGGYTFDMSNPDNGPLDPDPLLVTYMEDVKLIGRPAFTRQARILDDFSAQFTIQDFEQI